MKDRRFERSGGEAIPEYLGLEVPPESLGRPGTFPYTRGLHPSMYRGRTWTMLLYAGFGSAADSNRRYRYLLEQGQKGLSVAFDLPTQMGYDSDDPKALGEVGRVGVAIDSIEDMAVLMDGIPLDQVSTSMTINATAGTLLALYVVLARERGISADKLRGTIQNDVLKEYIARGTYIYPPAASMRIVTDIFRYCADEVPNWNTISISGYHIREAGSTAAQEVAFTLADGIAYVEAAVRAGLEPDAFAPRLSFFFNAHNNLLEEVAKFRAARRLWARIMRDRFGAKKPESLQLRFHAQTAGSTLTAQQVDNNVVRVTVQALAAVLGGAQSLHTNSKDEALALPTEASVTLALRTQQVLAAESGVADVVDPLGGSFAIERFTDEIEASAVALMATVDGMGGMVKAIEAGFPQRAIQDAAYRAQRALDAGERLVVGVNVHTQSHDPLPELLRVDSRLEGEQVERVRDLRRRRIDADVTAALLRLQETARGTSNLMPRIVEAVSARATLGEIAHALRAVFGVHREAIFL